MESFCVFHIACAIHALFLLTIDYNALRHILRLLGSWHANLDKRSFFLIYSTKKIDGLNILVWLEA